jgi:hypothetical protein
VTRWTVLFYLAGADDLEPYMARALLALEEAGAPPDVAVAVQLFRAPLAAAQAVLPERQPTGIDGDWSGARRYRLCRRVGERDPHSFASELVADLGAASPADPESLVDFVNWAAEQLPSERSLLVISGHGMGFVGAAMDLATFSRPAIMSIRNVAAALRRSQRRPDILLVDSCQMNCLEVLAQFALPRPAAGWMVTPASHAPRHGLDYRALLDVLAEHGGGSASGEVAARLAAALEPSARLQVLAFCLDPARWRQVAEIARRADGPLYSPMYAEAARCCVYPPAGIRLRLLVTWPNPEYFPEPYHYLYRRLQFARRSGWDRLLPATGRTQPEQEERRPLFVPGPILAAWLQMMRADLSGAEVEGLLHHLGWARD